MATINQEVYDNLKTEHWTYEAVAEEIGIDKEKFAYLMRNRFDTEDNSKEGSNFHLKYTLEWSERVQSGDPFRAADSETAEVLRDAGYQEN